MKHQPRLRFCSCDKCVMRKAVAHGIADAKCGRTWTCACGACQAVRFGPSGGVEVNFARLEYLEGERAKVRNVKTA